MIDSTSTPQGLMILVNWSSLPFPAQEAIIDALGMEGTTVAPIVEPTEEESYPLNIRQARELIKGIDEKTTKLLHHIAGNLDPTDDRYGYISWPKAKEITETRGWVHFAKGPLSGLHKRLRNITNRDGATLLFRNEYWDGQEETWGDDSTLYIDGQALQSLRKYFKIKS